MCNVLIAIKLQLHYNYEYALGCAKCGESKMMKSSVREPLVPILEGKAGVVQDVADVLDAHGIPFDISLGENCKPGG